MTWVRISPYLKNWPGGGPPPVFEINSDENGSAVIEIAWDPQALRAPASYPDPLRYYRSDLAVHADVRKASGAGTLSVSVPAQTITLSGGRAQWEMPAALWAGYVEDSLKLVGSGGPATTFSGNLYYRVRMTPVGAAQAAIWPTDQALKGPGAADAPHVSVLPMSATIGSQVVPDEAAIAALGGIPLVPDLWARLLRAVWAAAPPNDPVRRSLQDVFAHQTYKALPVAARSDILKLWLMAGKSRPKIPLLLSREVVTGTNVTTPIVSKIAYKGGLNLVQNLLQLVTTSPHPDLGAFTREQIVDDVIWEILDPNGQINQGGAGTCVPTSIQAFLISVNPAEYARLQAGWLGRAGSVELANGSTATVPPGVLQIHRYSQPIGGWTPSNAGFLARTYSEMAFQGAILRFAKGSAFPTSNGTEAQIQAVFQYTFQNGLSQADRKKAVDALFGANFRLSKVVWPPGPAGFAAEQAAVATAFATDMAARPRALLLALYWRTPPSTPLPAGAQLNQFFPSHVVLPIRIDGGRVYYKNPQYAGSAPVPGMANGGLDTNPPRRFEDIGACLESISLSDLAQWILCYEVSDKALT
ncbi:MAG TPA: hypothetical protein PKE40_03980 [Arachnia sp.]|nr:hypothetical protein [Arachnia sp.]HMT85490.1 hypothetical protein [Arachnia sp.]